jgi:ParB family chromosome partitioning protein
MLLELDPRDLLPDPDNVRRDDAEGLESLAASLREHGLLQPIGVTRDGSAYRVLYGSRRRAAAIEAGLERIACVLVEAAPPDRLVRQLVENLQRQDLNPLDQAEGLARLRRDLARRDPGSSDRELDEGTARAVGLSAATVRRYLGLRDLAAPVRDLLAEGQLSVTQAQHLGALRDAGLQEQLARLAVERGLSAAALGRASKALQNRPNLAVEEAIALAESAAELPNALPEKGKQARLAPRPKAEQEDDADLWEHEPADELDEAPVAGAVETADGNRVFKIRSVASFCDEVDRLARALEGGDLDRLAANDPAAPIKLRLTARQLDHASRLLNGLLRRRGWA